MNTPDYSGPNFCPSCGCNMRAIAFALQLGANGPTQNRFANGAAKPAPQEQPAETNGAKPVIRREPRPHHVTNPEIRATIGRRYEAGETIEALAAEYGLRPLTVKTIVYRARRAEGDTKAYNPINKFYKEIVQLSNEGKTHAQIAETLNVNLNSIGSFLYRHRRTGRFPASAQ